MSVALFPGSFDPMTNGHLDLVERALKIFDKVYVAVLVNESKKPLFTIEERLQLLREVLPKQVEIGSFEGLLVEFAEARKAQVLLRGLRAVSDFEYELQMAMMNRELNPRIETVFLMPKSVYSYLSSRLVKDVAALGGDVSKLVPEAIVHALKKKFSQGRSSKL